MTKKAKTTKKQRPNTISADDLSIQMTALRVQMASMIDLLKQLMAQVAVSVSEEERVADSVRRMFEALEATELPSRTEEFIGSLRQGFDNYGSLSPKQTAALLDNYNWFINGIPFNIRGPR